MARPEFFDELAIQLHEGRISRRRAIRLAGMAALGVAVGPNIAEGRDRARRRCRKKGGRPVDRGDCKCTWQCDSDRDLFHCHGNPDCACYKDASGRGFCGQTTGNGFCTANSDCDPGRKCALNTCSGGLCILPCPS